MTVDISRTAAFTASAEKGRADSCAIFKQSTYNTWRKLIVEEDDETAAFVVVEGKGDIYKHGHADTNFMIKASDLFACKDQEYPTLLKVVLFTRWVGDLRLGVLPHQKVLFSLDELISTHRRYNNATSDNPLGIWISDAWRQSDWATSVLDSLADLLVSLAVYNEDAFHDEWNMMGQ